MKIVLAEEVGGVRQSERAFEQDGIKIGRDPAECHWIFEQSRYPMVSRRHAEIRQRDGKYYLVDTNSSFGTLLDSTRITQMTELKEGSRIQLGMGGPILFIVHLEGAPAHAAAPSADLQFAEMETRRDFLAKEDARRLAAEMRNPTPPDNTPALPVAPNVQPPPVKIPATPPVVPPLSSARPQATPSPSPAVNTPSSPVNQMASAPVTPAVASPPVHPPVAVAPPQSPPAFAPPAPPPAAPGEATLEHIKGATGQLERITLKKDLLTLGRDPQMDVAIEANAAVVSRKHAEIKRLDGQYQVVDLGSFNGTLVNEQRITQPTPLKDGDLIQLGPGGPQFRFTQSGGGALPQAGMPSVAPVQDLMPPVGHRQNAATTDREQFQGTMVIKGAVPLPPPPPSNQQGTQLLMQKPFNARGEIIVGRAGDSDVQLDGLQISKKHARFSSSGSGITVEDLGSTNGVYLNGRRISGRENVTPNDILQVGPFVLRADAGRGVAVYDTRSKSRIDVLDIIKDVKNRSGNGMVRLLDDVDLTIQPNEFVGLLGPSGAGKSTLMDAMNGMRPASSGQVLINNLNLYQHLDSLKQSIGYVPQDDIIHRELTVYRTLFYVAKLRLSSDVTNDEVDQIINEVMDVTGLAERRDVPVGQLSGGQRKRVSIAVELITKPSIIYLDEPTSGLDPATEEKIMRLFRQIAESGRTVILTTHAMENVKLFDKIVVLMRGKLVWYGAPMDALKHIKAESFKDLYDKLEDPIEERIAKLPPLPPNATREQKAQLKKQREAISEQVADEWREKYARSQQYQQFVAQPLGKLKGSAPPVPPIKRAASVTDSVRQWITLARRYTEVLSRDKLNLAILFGQAPIIALLTYLVVAYKDPRDFPYFMLSLVAIWFGTSVAAREVIRERPVYNRERMVNLGLLPYIGSKLLVLSVIVGLQCFLLFGTMKFLALFTSFLPQSFNFTLPGYISGIPQLIIMILTGMVGVALGLLISATVKTSEMATSLVPLILIPQILFAGLVAVPSGMSKVVGLAMPATWSFDEMKRLSGLEVLRGEDEGAQPAEINNGRGLFKQIERENDDIIAKARNDIEQYKKSSEQDLKAFENDMVAYAESGGQNARPPSPKLGETPKVGNPVKKPDDISKYVDFLHPWGGIIINPLILIIMFFGLIVGTLLMLRAQDIK